MEEEMMPLPKDEATPPVTKMYLVSPTVIVFISVCFTIQGAKVGKKRGSAYDLVQQIAKCFGFLRDLTYICSHKHRNRQEI